MLSEMEFFFVSNCNILAYLHFEKISKCVIRPKLNIALLLGLRH